MSNFYRIRGLATRKLSVSLSIKSVDCYKTEESSAQIFTLLMKYMTRSIAMWIFLSVQLLVKRIDCDKMEERSVQFLYSFPTRRMVVGATATPSTWNFGSIGSRWNEIADFQLIFARSASAVTSSKKFNFELFARYRITTSITIVF